MKQMLPKRCQSIRKLTLSQVVTWKSSVLVLFPFDDGNMVWGICSGFEYILSPTSSHILPLIFIYQAFVGQKLVMLLIEF
jgi:hypothetical protein